MGHSPHKKVTIPICQNTLACCDHCHLGIAQGLVVSARVGPCCITDMMISMIIGKITPHFGPIDRCRLDHNGHIKIEKHSALTSDQECGHQDHNHQSPCSAHTNPPPPPFIPLLHYT